MLYRHLTSGGRFVGFSTLALVLSLGASISLSPSYVFAETDIGADGAQGTNGDPVSTEPGEPGLDGGSASASADPDNTAIAGHGGHGGIGNPGGEGGNGGSATATGTNSAVATGGSGGGGGKTYQSGTADGGSGGIASATSQFSKSNIAVATGGNGGESNNNNGAAGTAKPGATATAVTDSDAINSTGAIAKSISVGGNGGSGVTAGAGGVASSTAKAESNFGGDISVEAIQTGGNGGDGAVNIDINGVPAGVGDGGNGANSTMVDKVSGYSQSNQAVVSLTQEAYAGSAGSGAQASEFFNPQVVTTSKAGAAGIATSRLIRTSSHGEEGYFIRSKAVGGNGGQTFGNQTSSSGGDATSDGVVSADAQSSPDTTVKSEVISTGGFGGWNHESSDGAAGTSGKGGNALSTAKATAHSGDAVAVSTALGGDGGGASSSSGHAGAGGTAVAEATATTTTGFALATAIATGGLGGSGGLVVGPQGGSSTAFVSVKAGGVTLIDIAKADNGGTASVELGIQAPVNGQGPIASNIGGLLIESTIDHVLTADGTGTLTLSAYNGVEITVSGGNHTIASPVNFLTNTTVNVTNSEESLTIFGATTFTDGTVLTKSGGGELLLLSDLDIADTALQVMMESGTFSSVDPQISVSGDLGIGSALDLDLVGAFEPSIGDEFDIFDYTGTLTGVFDTVEFPSVNGLTFGIEYNTGAITLDVVLEGDLNDDGFVGSIDLNLVLGNFDQNVDAGVLLQGDPSGDGFVGSADLNTVLGNWNAGTPPAVEVAIPEPASIVLLGLGGLAIGRRS